MWSLLKKSAVSHLSKRIIACRTVHYSPSYSRGGMYNPANSSPDYILRPSRGHIQPKNVEMKAGYGCVLCRNGLDKFGYKDVLVLRQFINPTTGLLLSKRETGVCEKMQFRLRASIRRAMKYGYLPKTPYFKN